MFNIQDELKKLPDKPGVYIMKNADDKIIYIGKAVVLKNRVRQYFQSSKNKSNRVKKMISQIDHFEYIVTNSEMEALVLECNLIKYHKPKYNVLLKDDKTYPYVKITNEMYPRVFLTRNLVKDGSKYFGPYTNVWAIKQLLFLFKKIYPLRNCNKKFPKDIGKMRPCLNFHIGQCLAPCSGNVDEKVYNDMIDDISDFLNGKQDELIERLEENMKNFSANLEYESAAITRDKLFMIKDLIQKQKVSEPNHENKNIDVISWVYINKKICLQVFFMRNGKIVGREGFTFKDVFDDEIGEVIVAFLKQFYSVENRFIPKEIVIKKYFLEIDLIQEWLSNICGYKILFIEPKKGEKRKLLDMVEKNVEVEMVRQDGSINVVLGQLADILNFDGEIKRIESYDISNLGNDFMVGSMVVFDESGFNKNEYRRFKIKNVKIQSDVDCMREVIQRRFANSDIDLPDVILMDGGINQINAVIDIIKSYNSNIIVAGMYKDDKHRTKGIVLEGGEKIELKDIPQVFKLATKIQDEVHRFAIEYHRSLRSKELKKSVLDNIFGIGSKRKIELLKYFGSIDKIKEASFEDLLKVKFMDKKSAKSIVDYFEKL